MPVIFLTMHAEPVCAARAGGTPPALRAQGRGARELLQALQAAAEGGIYVSSEMAAEVFDTRGHDAPKRDPPPA